jgi:uncharacterized Zn finger protein
MNIELNLNDAADIACTQCGSLYFAPAVRLKKVSAVVSPTGEEMVVPIQLWECTNCGSIDEAILS